MSDKKLQRLENQLFALKRSVQIQNHLLQQWLEEGIPPASAGDILRGVDNALNTITRSKE